MKSLNGVAVVAAWGAIAVGGSAVAQDAVQWRVEDGGNGHWYRGIVISQEGVSWTDARSTALSWGADLVVLDSSTVAEWVWQHVANDSMLWSELFGPWVGAYQPAGSPEPDAGWVWVNGLAVASSIDWGSGQPDNYIPCGGENDVMSYFTDYQSGPRNLMCDTADVPVVYCPGGSLGPTTSAVIEWSADCNGDSIVDYGQILDGTFEDANENGVPDCCDEGVSCDPCLGDVNNDGQVNGADISVLLGFWGLNGKPVAADINQDGSVDGADLAQLLGSWGECP